METEVDPEAFKVEEKPTEPIEPDNTPPSYSTLDIMQQDDLTRKVNMFGLNDDDDDSPQDHSAMMIS